MLRGTQQLSHLGQVKKPVNKYSVAGLYPSSPSGLDLQRAESLLIPGSAVTPGYGEWG